MVLKLLGDPRKHGDRTEFEFVRIALDKAVTAQEGPADREPKALVRLRERRVELLRELATQELSCLSNPGQLSLVSGFWFRHGGADVCLRCPQVVTNFATTSILLRRVADLSV